MKTKFQIEYPMKNTSLSVLWSYISNDNGLSDWFADEVSVEHDKYYTFRWGDTEQKAELCNFRTGNYLRFHWLDDSDERTYFEFKVSINELTAEVMLIITDFAEPGEQDEIIDLWDSQIEKLRRITGII